MSILLKQERFPSACIQWNYSEQEREGERVCKLERQGGDSIACKLNRTVSAALDVYYRSSHEYKEFNSHNQKQMPN